MLWICRCCNTEINHKNIILRNLLWNLENSKFNYQLFCTAILFKQMIVEKIPDVVRCLFYVVYKRNSFDRSVQIQSTSCPCLIEQQNKQKTLFEKEVVIVYEIEASSTISGFISRLLVAKIFLQFWSSLLVVEGCYETEICYFLILIKQSLLRLERNFRKAGTRKHCNSKRLRDTS